MFFGAAERIRKRIRNLLNESGELKVIIPRLKNTLNIDGSSVLLLKEITQDMPACGKTLVLSGAAPKIRSALVDTGVAKVIDKDKILIAQTGLLESTRQAVKRADNHIETVLDGETDRREEDPAF